MISSQSHSINPVMRLIRHYAYFSPNSYPEWLLLDGIIGETRD